MQHFCSLWTTSCKIAYPYIDQYIHKYFLYIRRKIVVHLLLVQCTCRPKPQTNCPSYRTIKSNESSLILWVVDDLRMTIFSIEFIVCLTGSSDQRKSKAGAPMTHQHQRISFAHKTNCNTTEVRRPWRDEEWDDGWVHCALLKYHRVHVTHLRCLLNDWQVSIDSTFASQHITAKHIATRWSFQQLHFAFSPPYL